VLIDVVATLRQAARQLEAEKTRIKHQLAAIGSVVGTLDSAKGGPARAARQVLKPRRPRMSAAARRAVSQRMKAYWAKRKAAAKGAGKRA